MKICHFSDLHGNFRDLPAADLYIGTGDLLPNFPDVFIVKDKWSRDGRVKWRPNDHLVSGADPSPQPYGTYDGRKIDLNVEEKMQREWMENIRKNGGFRQFLGNPDAQVILVRGNHDFYPLSAMFEGYDKKVHEFDPFYRDTDHVVYDHIFNFGGLKIVGIRGINYMAGEWSDELYDTGQHGPQPGFPTINAPRGTWDERIKHVPDDLDILVTHAPPRGILDISRGESLGSSALASFITRRMHDPNRKLKAHFFGHIHESKGTMEIEGIKFSNAATGYVVHEI